MLEMGWFGAILIFISQGLAAYIIPHDPFWIARFTVVLGIFVFFAVRSDTEFLHTIAGYFPAAGIVGTALGFSSILPLMGDETNRELVYQHAGSAFLATIVGIVMWVINDFKAYLMERNNAQITKASNTSSIH